MRHCVRLYVFIQDDGQKPTRESVVVVVKGRYGEYLSSRHIMDMRMLLNMNDQRDCKRRKGKRMCSPRNAR